MSAVGIYSLPTGKLHKKTKKSKLKTFPAGYVGSFFRNLADNFDNFLWSDFYDRIANDSNIPTKDVQKYTLPTSDFLKGIQTDINHYVTRDRIANASFRQKLDPISKNILKRQNPSELVFDDILTFDSENPIVGSLLREHDVNKKDVASDLVKKVPRPPGLDNSLRKRPNKLKDRPEPKDNDNKDISPPPSPPPQPPPLFLQRPLSGPPRSPPFVRPLSGRFLEPFQSTPPSLRPRNFIGIPPAPSEPPLALEDFYILGPSSGTRSNNLYGSQKQVLKKREKVAEDAAQKYLNNKICELPNDS